MGCPSCDAGVGLTYLLQYKVSRYTTKLAGGNSKFWHAHGQPYYRFPLHVDRFGDYTQHQLLLDAAALGVEPVYCAPRFFETRELVAALQGGAVILRSELIPVTSLGPVASDQPHSVTYPADRSAGPPQVHSQPRRGRRLERLGDEDGQTRVSLDESLFYELSARVVERRRRLDTEQLDRHLDSDDLREADQGLMRDALELPYTPRERSGSGLRIRVLLRI